MSGEMLEADLRELGIGTVERVGSPGELRKLRMATDRTIVVVHDRDHGLRRCQPHVPDGVPLLRYRVGTGDGEVGPLLHGSWTMCADCATAHDVAAGDPSYAAASVVVGVVSQEILGRLTGAVPVQRSGRIRRFDVTDMRLEILDAYPAADCPRCGRDWPAAAEVAAYEWTYQRSAPNAGLPRPPRSLDRMQRLDALRVLRNPLHSGPRTPLPPAARLRSVEPVGAGLTSTVLSDLLALTAGRRGADQATAVHRAHSRYAPSGGNIGSVALYAAVPEDIGRPANITKYDDIEHRLVAINRNRRRLSELLAETDLPDNGALAVIYLVGEVGRLGQKYEDFAIRLGHLDAGCAALQLSLVAQARGLRVTFASSWSADPGRCLELDDDTEVVTAIAAIHANRPVEKEAP
jgi:SagB-type dehydrogenase family enzyme